MKNVINLYFVEAIVMKKYHSTITETLLKVNFVIIEKGVKLLKTTPLITGLSCTELACLLTAHGIKV